MPLILHTLLRTVGVLTFILSLQPTTQVESADKVDTSQVPGVVITHSPASSGRYIGSPSLAILPNGDYVASHDFFGPGTKFKTKGRTCVFRSEDRGENWQQVAEVVGAFWSNLFVHNDALYMLGANRQHGMIVIRRSDDGGHSWTTPEDADSGLITESGAYHTAPMPMVIHNGRIWRAFEDSSNGTRWPTRFQAMMISAPVDADLLKRSSWQLSTVVRGDKSWLDGKFVGWLEGNAVVTPNDEIVNILRLQVFRGGVAAIVHVDETGKTSSFEPERGFIRFPGAAKKFTIRFDPETKSYWSLVNWVAPQDEGGNAGSIRNTLLLICSRDLKDWEHRSVILHHPDTKKHGFQYVDWRFDGNDMIAVSRTAFDEGLGGAHNAHDANFMTFHRIENFRKRTMDDSVDMQRSKK